MRLVRFTLTMPETTHRSGALAPRVWPLYAQQQTLAQGYRHFFSLPKSASARKPGALF
jgi:hypothetical protein